MHSPCAPAAVFAQRALYAAVRFAGPRIIPGRRDSWNYPVDSETWLGFVEEWHALFGDWDSIALYRRPQRDRDGCALLLLRRGRGVGFIRITADDARARNEFAVMRGVHRASPETFMIAEPLGLGSRDGWSWLATATVPNYPLGAVRQRPVRARVINEIADILDDVVERSDGIPAGWRGAHGDLAPWNLRTDLFGRVIVIDWEDAVFAPSGSDLLYAELTAQVTFRSRPPESTTAEAAEWISSILGARRTTDEEVGSINNRLLAALALVPID